jgi:hypothetical protein
MILPMDGRHRARFRRPDGCPADGLYCGRSAERERGMEDEMEDGEQAARRRPLGVPGVTLTPRVAVLIAALAFWNRARTAAVDPADSDR